MAAFSERKNTKKTHTAYHPYAILCYFSRKFSETFPLHVLPAVVAEDFCFFADETFLCLGISAEPVAHPGRHVGIAAWKHVAMVSAFDTSHNTLFGANSLVAFLHFFIAISFNAYLQ